MCRYSLVIFLSLWTWTSFVLAEKDYSFSLQFGDKSEKILFSEKQIDHAIPLDFEFDFKKEEREELKQQILSQGEKATLTTPDGIAFETLFFNRNSDKLVVLGQGFPADKEGWWYEINVVFSDYDVVVFDFRWSKLVPFILKNFSLIHPINTITKNFMDPEKHEVITVVEHFKKQKPYSDVIGVGQCYGTYTFLHAQRDYEKQNKSLFTKLIFESCWFDLFDHAKQNLQNPWLMCNPQDGKTPVLLNWILNFFAIKYPLRFLTYLLLPTISLKEYLETLECKEILFIYGIKDLIVPPETFEKIWNSVKHESKTVLYSPFKHSENLYSSHQYKSHVCRHICNLFINAENTQTFQETLLQQIKPSNYLQGL